MNDFGAILAGVLVTVAAIHLVRHCWRAWNRWDGPGGCGGCGCKPPTASKLIPLEMRFRTKAEEDSHVPNRLEPKRNRNAGNRH